VFKSVPGCIEGIPGHYGMFGGIMGCSRGVPGLFRDVPVVFRGCSGVFRVLQTPEPPTRFVIETFQLITLAVCCGCVSNLIGRIKDLSTEKRKC